MAKKKSVNDSGLIKVYIISCEETDLSITLDDVTGVGPIIQGDVECNSEEQELIYTISIGQMTRQELDQLPDA